MMANRRESTPARQLMLVRHAMPAIQPEVPAGEWHLSPAGRRSCKRLALPSHIMEGPHEHDRRGEPYGDRARFRAAVRSCF
jgi:hypothetical protein